MPNARTAAALCAVFIMPCVFAQSPSSSLAGIVTDRNGEPVAEAPVRAVDAASGVDAHAFSSDDGHYEIAGLPSGSYVVSVTMPCCAFAPYANGDVQLEAGGSRELDIRLAEGGSLNVLGDDPGTINAELRHRQEIPDLPVPRTATGKPDLSGVWLITDDLFPQQPVALPWAEKLAQERNASEFRDHPHTRCLPSFPTTPGGSTPFISKLVQTPDLLVILFEDVPGFRQVFLDGRGHPSDPNPSWMGHSIGRWDGDTLVVDTVGFNDRGWNEAYPRTDRMHLEERFTRTEYGTMTAHVTIEDPGVFEKPWVQNYRFDLAPQEELIEYVCENNKWAPE